MFGVSLLDLGVYKYSSSIRLRSCATASSQFIVAKSESPVMSLIKGAKMLYDQKIDDHLKLGWYFSRSPAPCLALNSSSSAHVQMSLIFHFRQMYTHRQVLPSGRLWRTLFVLRNKENGGEKRLGQNCVRNSRKMEMKAPPGK